MDDFFDYNDPPGSMSPGNPRRFRSREELAAENERLHEELHHQQEENKMLAELLAGQFEDGDGEVENLDVEEDDLGERRPRFVISEVAIDLFEALSETFTLDEAFDAAERLSQSSFDLACHLRTYLKERMVVQEADRFAKTGRKPYF